GILDPAAGQVFALGNDPHAHHVVVLRDVPEPAFFRHVGDGGLALVNSRFAFGTFVVGPDSDLVQTGVLHSPAVSHGAEGLLPGAIQRHRRAILRNRTALFPDANSGDKPVFPDQSLDG